MDEFDHQISDSVAYYDSAMRMATDSPMETRSQRRRNRKERIVQRRGAFKWLPVHFSNDLVHGSWWFVFGSILTMFIPVVPLVDLFYPFWPESESSLPLLQDAATFGLLIVSGLFFTLGSYAFVRATEEPPLKPLFSWSHFATDELLAAWLFLFGTIPFPAFIAVYLYYNPHVYAYWGAFVVSLILLLGTYFFVLACYPTESVRQQIIPSIASFCCPQGCWVHKHLSNDWLAGTWIFFLGTLVMLAGSVFMMALALRDAERNPMEVFDWVTSTLDSFIFLIGCAYFCAGSYPPESDYIPVILRENIDKSTGLDEGFSSAPYQDHWDKNQSIERDREVARRHAHHLSSSPSPAPSPPSFAAHIPPSSSSSTMSTHSHHRPSFSAGTQEEDEEKTPLLSQTLSPSPAHPSKTKNKDHDV